MFTPAQSRIDFVRGAGNSSDDSKREQCKLVILRMARNNSSWSICRFARLRMPGFQ
jgi:hypothetical protein